MRNADPFQKPEKVSEVGYNPEMPVAGLLVALYGTLQRGEPVPDDQQKPANAIRSAVADISQHVPLWIRQNPECGEGDAFAYFQRSLTLPPVLEPIGYMPVWQVIIDRETEEGTWEVYKQKALDDAIEYSAQG